MFSTVLSVSSSLEVLMMDSKYNELRTRFGLLSIWSEAEGTA